MKGTGFDRLSALIASCASAGVARQAMVLRVDRLPPDLTRPHHVRLAEAALAPLLRLPRAELFQLPGPCLAVAWRGEAENELLDVVDELEHLLVDPAAAGPSLSDLVTLYDLPQSGDLLLNALAEEVGAPPPVERPAAPLDPSFLTLLEACLTQADVSRFARRTSVWQVEGPRVTLAWEDRTLSISELTEELAPGYDLEAEPWLFRRLTRTLDRRMLSMLASPGELVAAGPFALSLNVGSLLGPDFLRFDAALPAGLRGRVIVALFAADLVADARLARFAMGFARTRGYRLQLRTNTADTLGVLSPAALEFDHVELPWHPSLQGGAHDMFIDLIAGNLLLAGCDDSAAMQWGQSKGIRLFTGPSATAAALV